MEPMTGLEVLRSWDHYGYALAATAGSFCAVAAIAWVMQRSRASGWVVSLAGVAPPFINIVGVLFGLTLAFIANDTWNAHDRATHAVNREADALRSLDVLAAGLDEPLRAELRDSLRRYGRAVIDEWPRLARRQADPRADAEADALLRLVARADIAKMTAPAVHTLILRQATGLRDDRNLRIGLSRIHVNPLKWLGMAFLGLLTLLSVAVVHVDRPRAAIVSITLFALSAAPTAAIVLIQGNPFEPPSFVSAAPISAAIAR